MAISMKKLSRTIKASSAKHRNLGFLKREPYLAYMASKTITVEVRSELANACSEVLSKYGLTTEEAIQIFLNRVASSRSESPEERERLFVEALRNIPTIGYRNSEGRLVLPSDWDNPKDDIYDTLF